MQHFPIFLDMRGQRVVLSGGGEAALAKLRLLVKTEAKLSVYAQDAHPDLVKLLDGHGDTLTPRALDRGDVLCAKLFYAANEDAAEDARVAEIARAEGALVNIVDNLQDSQFITPAIVDRDPVTVAIGTEGAAPVLARAIKRDLEERLPARLGLLARIGKAFRPMAERLPFGRARRDFWAEYYFNAGPRAEDPEQALEALLDQHLSAAPRQGRVDFVGAGPGDPELLTLKARNALDRADVVIHDRLVTPEILELARREAVLIDVGKTGFGPSASQDDINAQIVAQAAQGAHVVRLKGGDPSVFGRLDEEIDAVEAAGLDWQVVPGITAASAAVAGIGQSLTKRGRNSAVRLMTGHDAKGLAEQDWRALAQPGAVTAIYMGKRAARFVQGRLMMHGAAPETPVSVVENAARADQRVVETSLAHMAEDIGAAGLDGPAITFMGLAPRQAVHAAQTATDISEEIA
ncbi:Siroheme synthase [Candidatus Rhodobacter oscarellae]|uniref:Siroheme synthase n=1 Tax=Candidatus Rhodobacter oscarellae TaxID=1675527 RepID=A0A0J9E1X4_9RHOB|nr:siroheme synthase CysG [Candidatus Rhodobacter lobularis]KMW56697.1 Siroheme synthase [Candidatus Rhodobacter lobularis]